MRSHRVALGVLALAFTAPATAHAGVGCSLNPDNSSFCTQHIAAKHTVVTPLGSTCHASRIYAIDASPIADASANAHFVAPHTIHMLNKIWSHHNKYGPLSVYGYYKSGHRIEFANRSRFAVNVYFTMSC